MNEQTNDAKAGEAKAAEAEAAKALPEQTEAKAVPEKPPAWLAKDYTGPLTCDQAAARIEHLQLHGRKNIGDLKSYETKPAAVASTKGGK